MEEKINNRFGDHDWFECQKCGRRVIDTKVCICGGACIPFDMGEAMRMGIAAYTTGVAHGMKSLAAKESAGNGEKIRIVRMLRSLAKIHLGRALLFQEGTAAFEKEVISAAVLALGADWIEKGQHLLLRFDTD